MHVPLELKSTNVADLNRQFQISGPIHIPYPQKDSEMSNAQILTRRSQWKCLCTDVQMYPRGEPSCHRHRKQRDDHLVKIWQGQIKWQWEKSHFMWQNRKGYTQSRTSHSAPSWCAGWENKGISSVRHPTLSQTCHLKPWPAFGHRWRNERFERSLCELWTQSTHPFCNTHRR